jgi:glycerol-3-phosphate acyltransferase PlsX
MRIALDAMGGDDAPLAMVQGAIDYAQANPSHTVILVGREHDIQSCLRRENAQFGNIVIEHAPETIGMADKVEALKSKPNDSMNRCAQLVKAGKADGMVLCGNTGCSVAAAQLHLRRIPGVKRAGILVPLPTPRHYTWMCDGGANSVCRPEWLVQFAELGVCYLETAANRRNPKVGVLSIGAEDEKGDHLTTEVLRQLRQTGLNVVGNVEGHDLYTGELDLVVCDGFTGNVVLKASEGVFDAIQKVLKEEIYRSLRTKLGGRLVKPAFDRLKRRAHWSYVGGCPLVGVDGVTIIGHGRSNRLAVYHAIGQAAQAVTSRSIERMRSFFRSHIMAGSSASDA